MKFNNLFFMALVLVLICSCKDTTLCYKIPLDNKELVICIPAFSDYAYLYIDAHESCVPTDSFDFKINNRGEATEVSLILNKHHCCPRKSVNISKSNNLIVTHQN